MRARADRVIPASAKEEAVLITTSWEDRSPEQIKTLGSWPGKTPQAIWTIN
jgi:hypothetical protein